MKRRAAAGPELALVALLGAAVLTPPSLAQEPFFSADFAGPGFGDFFNPVVVEYSACDDDTPLIPTGSAEIDGGELRLTNDETFGISLFLLRPEVVAEKFPTPRDYRARVRVEFETASEFSMGLKARLGLLEDKDAVVSLLERSYTIAVFPEGIDPEYPDGVLAIAEFTQCHDFVAHTEWPLGEKTEYARFPTPFVIERGEPYFVEGSVIGDEDGGPVSISASIWHAEDDAPATAQLAVADTDGFAMSDATRDPANEPQVVFAVSLDYPPGDFREPGASLVIDDIAIFSAAGCTVPPVVVRRDLWDGERLAVEGHPSALYEVGESYRVTLALSDPRQAGACAAAGTATVVELVPAGWAISGVTPAGARVTEGRIEWDVDLAAPALPELGYTVRAESPFSASFSGQVSEPGSERSYFTEGESHAASAAAVASISDFASIQHWLVLGPFSRQVGGANPGADEIARDYLTDGETTEATIRPSAGDTIEPDYGGAAASTGLLPNTLGRNPGGVPAWIEWRDLDDDDDRVDFESIYGAADETMAYALTYLRVEEDTVVNFGVSSDDAVHVLLDGRSLHLNAVARGALGRSYQDLPGKAFPALGEVELTSGEHVLLVKVFEGGGEHNFRVGFVDEIGLPLLAPPDGIEIALAPGSEPPPPPRFRRGDADADGSYNITDGIFVLNFLFLGGGDPLCFDAADSDDSGSLNITDGVFILNFLFTGGDDPPEPGTQCGVDPTDDGLAACGYLEERC